MIPFERIKAAHARVAPHLHHTPILRSSQLNRWLGHEILFKAECLQKVGAFKARGALNTLSRAIEQGRRPQRVIANSSGNHAQAVAWAAAQFDLPATIYMPANVSKVKAQATAAYGAEVVLGESRAWVDAQVAAEAQTPGTLWIPPYNHEDVIAGQGTAVYEALTDCGEVDAVFVPCGGGGLSSGALVATRGLCPNAQVMGVEPLQANDAAWSLREGRIVGFEQSPNTIADGARTLSVGPLTFEHLQALDGFYEVDEGPILYWTQWLTHLLKLNVEPTSAMTMAAVCEYLKTQSRPQRVLVVLSGGNIDHATRQAIWAEDCLGQVPSL
ncbi:serine/threonine dehydratase [Ferrimonas balearica]|uniref:serine/threonine dehydratase n=1 Tax=Ferrimonas balearica TaxID=44012 RepID=UPI001C99C53B|nr:serine/threonine dehydratase [Ferrimonas balearica]MBY5991381.1 serine/threonine dehydratase [Ferrimonas balearica]